MTLPNACRAPTCALRPYGQSPGAKASCAQNRKKSRQGENDMRHRYQILVTLALAALALPGVAAADDFPSRPIRAIASQGPGGLSDLFMRALGDQMGPALGTSIVVEDRVGAEGTIGAKACADAAPDGYTICILPGEAIVINPIIQPSDFDPSQRLVSVARP